jgi:phosphoglycolate phosphatase
LIYRPPCDSIIFDLDGTLWDASASSAKAWSAVAKAHNLDTSIDEAKIRSVSGLPFDQCVDILFKNHSLDIPHLRKLLDDAERLELQRSGGRIYPGVIDGLKRLQDEYKLLLVSNCQDWYLVSFFEHSGLKGVFRDSICFGQTGRSKKDNIREIIERNGVKKPVYIGDTHWDQEAAFYSGVKFIFARFGFGAVNVSCPSIDSFSDLVALMTSPTTNLEVETRRLRENEFEMAQQFYQAVGYVQAIYAENKIYGAFHKGELIGVVRLALEEKTWVLRGMQIHPRYQFLGIGSRLIRLLESEFDDESCFCLPHRWLDRFYGQIGFKPLSYPEEAPIFLSQRLLENQKKYPHLILMKREGK